MNLDFVEVVPKIISKQKIFVPAFQNIRSSDHMVRARDMYAIWDEDAGLWTRSKYDAVRIIDNYLREFKDENDPEANVAYLRSSITNSYYDYIKYCSAAADSYVDLDRNIIFANSQVGKDDHASFKLPYSIGPGPCPNYLHAMSIWFEPSEQEKLEWFFGYIISGGSMSGQKCLFIEGDPGTGKGSWVRIVTDMLTMNKDDAIGYVGTFKASDLGKPPDAFPAEAFVDNKRVMIDADCNLSLVTDNTLLNLIISHEPILMNVKFGRKFVMKHPDSALIMASNTPFYITDAKSGIIRRLIDAYSSGRTLDPIEYDRVMNGITFEYGAIAQRCLDVYNALGPNYFANYIPIKMIRATNDFYNFVDYWRDYLRMNDPITLANVFDLYQKYCDLANIEHKKKRRQVETEMKSYYTKFEEDTHVNGVHIRKLYSGFRYEKFDDELSAQKYTPKEGEPPADWLVFKHQASRFDIDCSDWPAQYAKPDGKPLMKWSDVTSKLSDIDTTQLHYTKPLNPTHIVLDFDLKDADGNKSLELNMREAAKFPPTYAELSKSGAGIHLHYIYTGGDPAELSRIYDVNIEVKVFTGNASLRRKLTMCNDLPIATINSGLPLKEKKGGPVVGTFTIDSERKLRMMILKNLNKEYFGYTKPSIDYIYDLLEMAYNELGLHYDVHDMQGAIFEFALQSSNNYKYCVQRVNQMKFKSAETGENESDGTEGIIFEGKVTDFLNQGFQPPERDDIRKIVIFDVEVFPNHWGICWHYLDSPKESIVKMIDPSPEEVTEFCKKRFGGFNNRKYDNHILWAAMMGYSIEEIYRLSQDIISNKFKGFAEAYNLSDFDIYDFASTKQSLKKWEIMLEKLGYDIKHQECRFRWDQPVNEEEFAEVMDYCANDVWATEILFKYKKIQADYRARCMLAKLSGLSVNDTTRQHTTKIIFQGNKHPELVYVDLAETFPGYEYVVDEDGPHNMYMGEDAGFGGYVFACHGPRYQSVSMKDKGYYGAMACDVALLDIESLHPNSIRAMNVFGAYTKRFTDILDARLAIKHGDYEAVKGLLDGALVPFLGSKDDAKDLAQALKIIINSVYGYTSASFDNPFKDPRNKNNIVALRGALFMILLKSKVIEQGYSVLHIKTDSIKIPNATPEIIKFCMDFAKEYGYTFAHEATYSKMCLVNQSTYIAHYASPEHCRELYGYVPKDNQEAADEGHKWTATGLQFQVPYVFKTLFSHEDIIFDDMCETKSVTSGEIYLDNNEGLKDATVFEKELETRRWNYNHVRLKKLNPELELLLDEDLEDEIAACHNYIYVGKVGSFCPIKPGCGGGLLMRSTNDGKYAAVTGSTGYRWMEAADVKALGMEAAIDRSYYDKLVDQAVEDLSIYGDFEWFASEDEPEDVIALAKFMNAPKDAVKEEVPFEEVVVA